MAQRQHNPQIGWTMTREREQKLSVAQRRMLRKICQTRRSATEPWMDWIQRATDEVLKHMATFGLESWVVSQRRRKWRWAGIVARLSDDRWTQRSLLWKPEGGRRNVGRPWARWTDDIENFIAEFEGQEGNDWFLIAHDACTWQALESAYSER